MITENYPLEGPQWLTAQPVTSWYPVLPDDDFGKLHELLGIPAAQHGLTEVPLAPEPQDQDLVEPARQLACRMRNRWERALGDQGVIALDPIPVRWERVPELEAKGGNVKAMLPETGGLNEIVQFYRNPSREREPLVVLGQAGSGKTVLATRLALELLKTRAVTDMVPFIFSIGSWDPAVRLDTWLIGQLERDYTLPFLTRTHRGVSTLAAALFSDRRILPVLDGFDELAPGLRSDALKKLNKYPGKHLVLTSRVDEYKAAVEKTGVLHQAACLQLTDLAVADLSGYFPSGESEWDDVLDKLRDHPEELANTNLRTALATPLMLSIARTIFSARSNGKPSILLDAERFKTSDDIKEHLLETFVGEAYPQPPDPTQDANPAPGWLAYLARHLGRTDPPARDLSWWELGTATLSRPSRILLVGLASGAGAGLTAGCISWFVDTFIFAEPAQGLEWGIVNTLLGGLIAIPVFASVHGFALLRAGRALKPSRMRILLPGRGSRTERRPMSEILKRFMFGLAVGLVAGVVTGFLTGLFTEPLGRLMNGFAGAVVFGPPYALGSGLVLGLFARLEASVDSTFVANPRDLLNRSRKTAIRALLMFAPIFGLVSGAGGWLVVAFLHSSLWSIPLDWNLGYGLWVGLNGASATGIAGVLSLTAWGQWVVLARIWLPLTGHLPWRPMTFLEEAHEHGVLRQNGAVYQFRHDLLQAHLTRPTEHRAR